MWTKAHGELVFGVATFWLWSATSSVELSPCDASGKLVKGNWVLHGDHDVQHRAHTRRCVDRALASLSVQLWADCWTFMLLFVKDLGSKDQAQYL